MHRKEEVIAPLLEHELGIQVRLPSAFAIDFNTDRFGTFTRDVKRPADQLQTARLKIQTVLDATGQTLGIASEGAFGPHPALPYLPCNREMVVFVDRLYDLEIVGQVVSTQTNYRQQQVSTYAQALEFAYSIGFPDHGLVVIASSEADGQTHSQSVIKGITTEEQLREAMQWALTQANPVQVETDMRAMYNPTRMQVIAQATQELLKLIQSTCPACNLPGFSILEQKPGLPCQLCYLPTPLVRSVIYQCQTCDFQREDEFPKGVQTADPTYCPYCNP